MRGLALLAVVGCSYSPSPATSDAPSSSGDAPAPDGMITSDAPPPDTMPPMCPATYSEISGSRYRSVPTPAAWLTAETDCENDGFGTHLVVVGEITEIAVIDALSGASNTWVGLSNLSTTWRWVDGSAGPLLSIEAQQCGKYFDGSGGGGAQLQTDDCGDLRAYVCECDLVEPDPDAF